MKLTNKLMKKIKRKIKATDEQKKIVESYAKVFGNPQRQKIIDLLVKNPLSKMEISEKIYIHLDNLNNHIKVLLENKIIYEKNEKYHINKETEKKLREILGALFK